VTGESLSLAFFDGRRGIHGSARAGATLLFKDGKPSALAGGPEVERSGEGWRSRLADHLELGFEPVAEPVDLPGARVHLCQVSGTAEGTAVDCLGTATVTTTPPPWSELDAVRAISALFDTQHAVFLMARRPRGALGHGEERVSAMLLAEGSPVAVETARISTVYDGDGRQRSGGIELWLPGEEFPRRVSGTAQAGASLELEGLEVGVAVFTWSMEGREGLGGYELAVRSEGPVAA
jgi:hypothetical protein